MAENVVEVAGRAREEQAEDLGRRERAAVGSLDLCIVFVLREEREKCFSAVELEDVKKREKRKKRRGTSDYEITTSTLIYSTLFLFLKFSLSLSLFLSSFHSP